jgi:FlaA1/EpsC-like NDP-sugar epimerase
MGATKRVQELIAQAMADDHPEIRVSMVRFGNVLGSSGSVVPLFRAQIQRGGPVTVTDPEVTRYFMTIPEAAQLVIQAGALGGRGDLFVLDMGEPVRICDLARKMIHLSGLSVRDGQNPSGDIDIVYSGLRPGEKLYEELLIDAQATPTTHPRIRRARESFLKSDKLGELLAQLSAVIAHDSGRQVYAVLKQLVSGYSPRTAAQVVNISDIRSTRAHTAVTDSSASPPESPAMSPN